jgi:hypothetical protein
MNTNNARIEILTMAKDGKIDLSEATRRLQALDPAVEAGTAAAAAKPNRSLRVVKIDLSDEAVILDLSLPLSLVEAANRIGAQFGSFISNLTRDRILAISSAESGTILSSEDDEARGERTIVTIE